MSILFKSLILTCSYFATLLGSQANASVTVLENAGESFERSSTKPFCMQQQTPLAEIELASSNLGRALSISELKETLNQRGRTVTSLDISGNNLGDEALSIISSYPHLQHLFLNENCLTDKGASDLQVLKTLKEIDLSSNTITATGIKFLPLEMLEILQVNFLPLGLEGIKVISKAPRLKHLNIKGAALDDQSIDDLSAMKMLEILDVSYNKISPSAITKLKQQLPNTQIVADYMK